MYHPNKQILKINSECLTSGIQFDIYPTPPHTRYVSAQRCMHACTEGEKVLRQVEPFQTIQNIWE